MNQQKPLGFFWSDPESCEFEFVATEEEARAGAERAVAVAVEEAQGESPTRREEEICYGIVLGRAVDTTDTVDANLSTLTLIHYPREDWKALAEAPYPRKGMKVSLYGFISRVSEYLERRGQGGDAFQLREIQRHLCEVWDRRGEPAMVSEFGTLYCLDKEGPILEREDPDEEEDEE